LLRRLISAIYQSLLRLLPLELLRDIRFTCFFISNTDHAYISENLLNTLILAEDRRFLFHPGVDPVAVVRALFSLLFLGKLQGASTIEQQLVRTVTKRYNLSITRKLREMFLALLVSSSFPKEQIAKAYLSIAYFGWQMNGIDQACDRLSINVKDASLSDAAEIIARLKYPEPEVASLKRHQQIQVRVSHIIYLQRKAHKKTSQTGYEIGKA
jgi:membrane carboxypeptidase/penicillin-binding protein